MTLIDRLVERLPILVWRLALVAGVGLVAATVIVLAGGSWNWASDWVLRICLPVGLLVAALWFWREVRGG